jgi:phage shock protein PspC (stress-responsive transcriptional regulator)
MMLARPFKWGLSVVKRLFVDLHVAALILAVIVIVALIVVEEPTYSSEDLANCMPPTGSCEYWGQ